MGIAPPRPLADNLSGTSRPRETLVLIPNFTIHTFRDQASVYVLVSGDVDISTAPRLEAELTQAQEVGLPVIVDLEFVEFMDCAGLRALVRANADGGASGLTVTPGPPQVQRLFELFGIDGLVPALPHTLGLHRNAA